MMTLYVPLSLGNIELPLLDYTISNAYDTWKERVGGRTYRFHVLCNHAQIQRLRAIGRIDFHLLETKPVIELLDCWMDDFKQTSPQQQRPGDSFTLEISGSIGRIRTRGLKAEDLFDYRPFAQLYKLVSEAGPRRRFLQPITARERAIFTPASDPGWWLPV